MLIVVTRGERVGMRYYFIYWAHWSHNLLKKLYFSVNYKLCILLLLLIINFKIILTLEILPYRERRYDQVTFLTSHNSYASQRHGYRYAQQRLTLQEQLDYGVRGFMLDTYRSASLFHNDCITLCHGSSIINRFITTGKSAMTLIEGLKIIKTFLVNNPEEVITIFLENYVVDSSFLDQAFIDSGVASLIFKPTDWNFNCYNQWPTLKWMQKNNKRLVIFNSRGQTQFTFNEWEHVIENQYGTLNIKKALQERKESQYYADQPRSLLLVNYIPTLRFNLGKSYTVVNSVFLSKLLSMLYQSGLEPYGLGRFKTPNFINIDFVDEGSARSFVDICNTF